MLKKRNLFLVHRWLGIGMCGLFLLWFITGIIMLYTRMPLLYPEQRFAGLAPIQFEQIHLTPHEALHRSGLEATPRRIRLGSVFERPAYFFLPPGEKWVTVFADNGERLPGVAAEQGARMAQAFVGADTAPRHLRTFDGVDQWTFSNSMNLHRPLHRYRIDDRAGTEVYVSEVTGEVVNVTTGSERVGAAVGAYIHWLAPEFLRRSPVIWRNLLLWLSVAGTALAISGLVIGLLRYRRQGYPNRAGIGGRSPYRGLMRWHHWGGLIFGTATLTWIFSGVLYMNPGGRPSGPLSTVTTVTPYNVGGIRADLAAKSEQTSALSGGPLETALWSVPPAAAWAKVEGRPLPKEAEMVRFGGRPYYVFAEDAETSWVVPADGGEGEPRRHFDEGALIEQVRNAVPGGNLIDAALIQEYDGYYYSVGAVAPKRLPILRVKYDDPEKTWLYINPHNASIFRRYDQHGRVMRWLVNGLHCLDFPFLIKHRPAWDIAVISLSVGGIVLSGSGMVMGWRRLQRERKQYKPAPPKPRTISLPPPPDLEEQLGKPLVRL